MSDASEFARLMAGLRAGEPAAVEGIARRYGRILRAAIRKHLHPRLRARVDSVDVAQDVWASFLALPPDRRDFDSPRALVAFLKQVAYRRTVEVYRERFETQKNDIDRETDGEAGARARVCTPTPSMCVSAAEQWDRMLGALSGPQRAILHWLREGHDLREIARRTNISLSTVSRVVKRLKEMNGL